MQSSPHRADGPPERGRFELESAAIAPHADAVAPLRTLDRPSEWRLRGFLAERYSVWLIVAASLALCAPAIATGYILDDYFHTVALRSGASTPGVTRAAWDAYRFASSPEQIQQLVELCVVPWWSDPQARMAFFRPLASLTLWLDHRLWPSAPALMHLHSLCWYGLLLLVVAAVYRRFAVGANRFGFAGAALLLYGIDDAHAWSVGWLANRAALGALAVGLAALLAHDRWRSSGKPRFLWASLALLALALGFGESVIQAVAYLIAYAWFFDSGSRVTRCKSLAPYAVLLVVWRLAYVVGGYGAAGTSFYTDPVGDPIRFTLLAAERLPVLLSAQLGGLSADLGDLLQYAAPAWVIMLTPLCLAVAFVCAWMLYPFWRSRREVRFWTSGMLLSMLPVCALPPADRLLIGPGVGGSALVAIVLLATLDRARETRSRSRRLWAASLAVVHLGIAPLLLPVQAYGLSFVDKYIGDAERSIPEDENVADKTVVLLNPPTDEFGIYAPMRRRARGGVMPKQLRWIATGDSDLAVRRLDANPVIVRPSRGFFAPGSIGTLRTSQFQSHVGDVVALDGLEITTTQVTDDGRPAEAKLAFDAPLDGDGMIWMRWNDRDGFEPLTLPAIGHVVVVPAINSGSVLVD